MKLEPLILKPLADGPLAANIVASSRDFVPAHKPKAEEAPAEPTFSEADLKAAERDGYQKGFLEGVKEGHQQAATEQAAVNARLAALAGRFEAATLPLFEDYRRMYLRISQELPKIAFTVARKVAGAALQENAAEQVAQIATRCCESMMSEPQLIITAHESLGDTLEKLLSGLAARLPDSTQIIILRDPAIPASDCKVEWKLGAMHYSTQEIWDKVEKAVHTMAALSMQEHEQQMDTLRAAVTSEAPPAPEQSTQAPPAPEGEAEPNN